ncbi:MAG: TetR/AcrR family transcriptional regulator [Acidimicrobiales bacterium]|nr:TetR/AcrR family transcriptional regulator [Acidimicrobiales bacterium]
MSAAIASDGRTRGAIDLRAPRERILDATLRVMSRVGVSGLTLDDVARDAGCGRATVYRTFPGGRDEVLQQAALAELDRYLVAVGAALDAAEDLATQLTAAVHTTAVFVSASAPLRHVLANEPAAILAHVAFDKSPVVFAVAHDVLAPRLARHLPADRAAEAAEWLARLGLSYLAVPRPGVDLTDRGAAHHLVSTFVLPGLADRPTTSSSSTSSTPSTAVTPRS